MTPEGAKLDVRLGEIIGELKAKESLMPEVGGRKLAGEFSGIMADIRKSIDESKNVVSSAANELKQAIVSGANDAAKALRAEAMQVQQGYAELLGNAPPETTKTAQSTDQTEKKTT